MPSSAITADSAALRPERAGPLSGAGTVVEAAARPVWTPFWRSRVLVWVIGMLAATIFGAAPEADPAGISTSFGRVGNLIAAPAVRWDAIGYLDIAQHGYQNARSTAFYPLYPLVVRAGSWLLGSPAVTGVLISLAAMLVALAIVRRLTELEFGRRAADVSVQLIAFGPVAVFLSAVYTESLFLALSAGMFYAARRGRWATAGALGALAALTRVSGIALLVPFALIFFYGPRTDAPPIERGARWKPRYPATPAVLWALLIPAAFAAFAAYLQLRGFGAGSMIQAQRHFLVHRLMFPAVAAWEGLVSAWHQLRLELHGVDPIMYQSQSVFQSVALALALAALVGVLRRLPLAYGAYVIVGLTIALSTPTVGDPLRGLARYASVLFPLLMWAAAWAVHRRVERTVILGSCALLVLFTIEFATWHLVGTPLV